MAGSGAAVRAGEHAAEGIIAKAAKDVLRDAEGPLARAGETAARDTATSGSKRLTKLLQTAVTKARADLLKDPELAARYLSPRELAAVERRPWLARIHFGNALERRVAEDSALDGVLRHAGNASEADFYDDLTKLGYEVTTSNPRTIAAHLRRDYVHPDRLATYDPIPSSFRFPRLDL